MNNLEFRIWDKEKKEYFKPIYEAHSGKLLDLSITLSGELLMRTLKNPAIHESIFLDRYTIEQYTGRTDQDDVKIFKHDIVIYEHIYAGKQIGVIVYNETEMGYWLGDAELRPCSHPWGMMKSIKVIGNINKNAQLLKS